MIKATVEIKLTLTGPILTQSSNPGTWGLDIVAARNADDQFYISGTLLLGKLRQAWQELQEAIGAQIEWFNPDFDKWLGKPSDVFFSHTKQLYFSDLIHQSEIKAETLNRIKIDPERGAVAENQLVIIENPFLVGQDYDFVGALHFFAVNQNEVDNIVRHVEAGLSWTNTYGALRSVGFGRVKNVDCSTSIAPLNSPVDSLLEIPEQIGLSITPLYPFCIGNKRLTDNLFESVATLSGGVILGSIATTWHQISVQSRQQGKKNNTGQINDAHRATLKTHFNLLRITHALPSLNPDSRPVILPLSLVTVADDKTLYDVILLDNPCLINNKPPAFSVDWQDDDDTVHGYGWPNLYRKTCGWDQITKEIRTRMAINPATLRADDDMLFSYEQVVPENFTWNAQVDLSRIPANDDRARVLNELQSLLSQGVAAIGKTKTPAKVTWQSSMHSASPSNTKALDNRQWIVTLQTDTLLGSPEGLNESSGQAELHAMYEKVWSDLSNGTLRLIRYFARQSLAGSYARHKLFQDNAPYKPWLLTEAGSVFLLQADNEATGEVLIKSWLAHGLPLTNDVLTYYGIPEDIGSQWQHCPFIPQNGYGEIAVNLAVGERLSPKDKRILSISVL